MPKYTIEITTTKTRLVDVELSDDGNIYDNAWDFISHDYNWDHNDIVDECSRVTYVEIKNE